VRDLFAISRDGRGQPYGLRHRYEVVETFGPRAAVDDVVEALRSESAEQILGALLIVPSMARTLEDDPDALLAALLERVAEPTSWAWPWGEHSHQRRVFNVAPLAVEGVVALLLRRVRLHRRDLFRANLRRVVTEPTALDLERLEGALQECVRRALDNRDGQEALRASLRAVRQVFSNPATRLGVTRRMADVLVATSLDPARFGHVRWMAAVELDRAARTAAPEERELFEAARGRALRGLSDLLDDPIADIHLKRHMRQNLAAVAPELVAELLHNGRFSAEPLPDPDALLNRFGAPIESLVQAAALQVTTHAVLAGLDSDDPAVVLAAAAFAPVVAGRGDGEEIAKALLGNIGRGEVYVIDGEPRPLKVEVGTFAAERLLQLIAADARQGREPAFSLLLEGVRAGLRRGVDEQQRPFAPVSRFLDAARWGGEKIRPRVLEHLRRIAVDPAESGETRFVALLLDRSPEANAIAAAALLDGAEDPALRALVGTRIFRWSPETLHGLVVEPAAPLWTPAEGVAPLPVTDPGAQAPMEWLVEALIATAHPRVRNAAIRALGTRLNHNHGPVVRRAAMEELRALDNPALRAVFRAVIDDVETENLPRWSACICLAAFGGMDDHDRLVHFAALRGAWSRLDPDSEEFATAELLDHLTLNPLSWEEPHSMLEPYLRMGYGDDDGDRMMAQVFALLGRKAMQAGLAQYARTAFARATALDPLNLAARRAARL